MGRDEKIMFEIYRAICKKLNVDLVELIENDITKKEMWFLEYIRSSDMYILWYNARNNQRKWIKLWGI